MTNQSGNHRLHGTYNCPADFATITMIYAVDADDAITLRASRTGCAIVSNGTITNAWISAALDGQLTALVGAAGR